MDATSAVGDESKRAGYQEIAWGKDTAWTISEKTIESYITVQGVAITKTCIRVFEVEISRGCSGKSPSTCTKIVLYPSGTGDWRMRVTRDAGNNVMGLPEMGL